MMRSVASIVPSTGTVPSDPAWIETQIATLTPPRSESSVTTRTFVNPVNEGADPWVIRHGPHYYFCQTEGHDGISVSRSERLTDRGIKRVVWRPGKRQWNSRDIWAPELHYIKRRWYIYYAASNGRNENHRSGVLGALTGDPLGEYENLGILYTGDDIETGQNNRWAIDATPLELNGRLYLVWSGWPADEDRQYLYIAPMESPTRVAGNRIKLCENDCHVWERVNEDPSERGLHEGPQILHRFGKVFIVYSCSSSWDPTYKLNMLAMDESGDPLVAANWIKSAEPVFRSTPEVFGIGHACFTTSPDGSQDWIVFHAKRSRKPGWERAIWMQPFGWTQQGTPDFGEPVLPGSVFPAPSGESAAEVSSSFRSAFEAPYWDDWSYYGHGRYIRVENNTLHLGGAPGRGAVNLYRSGEKALVRNRTWSDATYRARMRLRSARGQAGLLFRVQRPGLGYHAHVGYSVMLSPRDRAILLGTSDGKNWRLLQKAEFPVTRQEWYDLRVKASGTTVEISVNDAPLMTLDDSNHLSGLAGIGVLDSCAEVSSFSVE